jgi:hypothetical protein
MKQERAPWWVETASKRLAGRQGDLLDVVILLGAVGREVGRAVVGAAGGLLELEIEMAGAVCEGVVAS